MAVEEEAIEIPEWVVTFGDMMSLLLTFFIMLVSLSEIEQANKYQAVVQAMRKQFGYDSAPLSMIPGHSKPRNQQVSLTASLGRSEHSNKSKGGLKTVAPEGKDLVVRTLQPGSRTAVGGVVWFADFSISLDEQQKRGLRLIVDDIGGKPQKIEIRGYPSRQDLPQGLQHEGREIHDGRQLAFLRARHVTEFLIQLGIERKRIRVAVGGSHELEQHEVNVKQHQHATPVEVYLLDEIVTDLKGGKRENEQWTRDKKKS